MKGKRHFRLLTAGEQASITAGSDRLIEWKRKAKNPTAFPQATIDAAKRISGLTLNYLNEQWFVVEIK